MNRIRNALVGFVAALFEPDRDESTGDILHFRLFELFIVVYVIHGSWQLAAYMKNLTHVVHPLGLAIYIDPSFMYGTLWPTAMAACISVLSALAYLRVGGRAMYVAAFVLFHWQYVARDVLGEIGHSSHFVGVSLLALALGMGFFRQGKDLRRFVWGMVFFYIGLGYTTAALCKLFGTGIIWSDGRHLWMWIHEKGVDVLSRTGTFEVNWLQRIALGSRDAASWILTTGWIMESAGSLLWFRSTRPWVTTGLIGMHVGIMLTMNIHFDPFIYQLAIMGFPWGRWLDRFAFLRTTRFARIGCLA
jgi:hypothetical protein